MIGTRFATKRGSEVGCRKNERIAMPLNEQQYGHFRHSLTEMRRRISDSVEHVLSAITDDSSSEANISNLPVHPADVAQTGEFSDVRVLDNQGHMLMSIENALQRLDEGAYGICEACGRDIPLERLDALPFATMCTSCAALDERSLPLKPR